MPIFRTFGIEEHEVLDKVRRFRPIIPPHESRTLEESLDKLVKYLLRGRGSAAEIKVQTERIDGETVVFAELDEGVIIFNTVYPDEVVNFMRVNYPLLPPYKVRDERTPKGWTKTTQGVRREDDDDDDEPLPIRRWDDLPPFRLPKGPGGALLRETNRWLVSWINDHGYKAVELLGKGSHGYAYLLEDGRVLKATWDRQEKGCVEQIVDGRLWEATPHLPQIFETGVVPAAIHLPWAPEFFYVREYLVPLKDIYVPEDQYKEQVDEMFDNIYQLGIIPIDLIPDNLGYRMGNAATLVLLDVNCARRRPKGHGSVETIGARESLEQNDLEAIKSIAQQTREACESQWPESPAAFGTVESCLIGRCIPCTEFLVQRLQTAGFPAKRAWGRVWVDGYFSGDTWGGEVIWHPEPRYPSSIHDNWFDHQFAWIDGLVVDITGDQFNELIQDPEEKIPPVLIARWEDLPRYDWHEDTPAPYLIEVPKGWTKDG